MRDNGLPGADYILLADLDAGLVEAALTLLRDAGVPAYAETTTPAQGPAAHDPGGSAHEAGAAPGGLTDRLFVERRSAEQARALLAEGLRRMADEPGAVDGTPPAGTVAQPGQRDVVDDDSKAPRPAGVEVDDDVWAGIVASFRAPSADMSGRVLPPPPDAPAAEPLTRPSLGDAHEAEQVEPVRELDYADHVDHDDHFEPDPPPPLPRITFVTALAWAAVLLMPALFLLALWLHIDVTGWLGLFGVSAFVGGFLVLVSRLGDGPEDWDDGAVV